MSPDDLFEWIPDDQLHVVATLAYVDSLIERAGDLHFSHLQAGAFEVRDVVVGGTSSVTVDSVAQPPAALGRTTADILNQLRSAIEHTLFVEVARQEERDLTSVEVRTLEMPASTSFADLARWSTSGGRKSITTLQIGGNMFKRIESLMPFQRRKPHLHPMRLLASHTNEFKHRTPAVAATFIGRVNADFGDERLTSVKQEPRPAAAGDVLATAPAGSIIPISIWPKISLRRPYDGSWRVLMHELRDIEVWVREVAIPILITGGVEVSRVNFLGQFRTI